MNIFFLVYYMNRLFSISILVFIYFFVFSPNSLTSLDLINNFQDFEVYQKTFSKEEVYEKIEQMLKKDPEIELWYNIQADRLNVYACPEDKVKDIPEFTLYFGHKEKFKKTFPSLENSHMPLKGLRIAIDPGHIGGNYAKIEEKYVEMSPNREKNIYEPLAFHEGELSVITAKKLAKKLEALGAKVFLTKSNPGEVVYKKKFEEWFQNDISEAIDLMTSYQEDPELKKDEIFWWTNQATSSEIFRLTYNYLDVERRAELINAFKPHVTVSCHYNLGCPYDKDGKSPGTSADYTFFFVPGAFKKGDTKNEAFSKKSLKNARSRYEFIRFIVTDDIEQSIDLAKTAVSYSKQILKSPILNNVNFAKDQCLYNSAGIYHRNLCLNCLVHGPLLYGEPLLQDNYSNAKILASNPDVLIDKVVNIYYRSILDWAESLTQSD
ncbi:MAG: hypothetical protein S4CHLAM6_10550 [Chlamydiae bacterium]|nr:hypothetical protein [Chlamydiota bacterium]